MTIVLYAVWIEFPYTIRFNSADGTDRTSTQEAESGAKVKLNQNPFTRKHYKFAGWSTSNDLSVVDYEDGYVDFSHTATKTGEIYDLYAVWTKLKVTIKYDFNGGVGTAIDDKIYDLGDEVTVSFVEPTYDYYEFLGYATDSDARIYGGGDTFIAEADKDDTTITLKAIWKKITYKIVFNSNGATSGSMDDIKDIWAPDSVALSENRYRKTNYRFVGWTVERKDNIETIVDDEYITNYIDYTDKQTITRPDSELSKDTYILYAVWKRFSYNINFDRHGADGGNQVSPQNNLFAGDTITLNQNTWTKTGNKFIGWTDVSGSNSVKWTTTYTRTINQDTNTDGDTVILYAVWAEKSYNIIFHKNIPGESDITTTQPAAAGVNVKLNENTWEEN